MAPRNQNNAHAHISSRTSRYRPEIDGLRAFAVAAVIINHFNKDILPGGYLGVDIFFVISGYVITSSLFERPSKDFRDFISGFYSRRVKRLVPALSVFVLTTSIAICLFNSLPAVSLQTGLTSLFGLSNLYLLWQSTDYFAHSAEINVFTHTWSLGVEEQFYIVFPLLIWFSGFGRQTKNGARNLFLTVGALSIASLIIFLYLYPTNQPAAYFLMPSRFWEMAAGCLIFIGFQRRKSIEQWLEKVPPLLLMALIVGVMYLPLPLASASTVAVVTFSSILIASLKEKTAAFKIFTDSRIVYIGLISYSLYLWHWGVLSISRWTIGIHWWSIPIQIALMLGLAVASYRWIETPLRKGNWFGRRWKTLAFGGGALISLSGGLLALDKQFKGRLYLGNKNETQAEAPYAGSNITRENCMDHPDFENAINKCWINKEYITTALPRIFFIGDSHTESMSQAAEYLSKKINSPIFIHSRRGTLFPVFSEYWMKGSDRYAGFSGRKKSNAIQSLAENFLLENIRRGDIVVVTLRLPYYFGRDGFSSNERDFVYTNAKKDHITRQEFFKTWQSALSEFASALQERGASLIVSTPSPEWNTYDLASCARPQWFNTLNTKACVADKAYFDKEYYLINKFLIALEKKRDNVYIFDTLPALCPGDECHYLLEGVRLYRDKDHLSNHAMREIIGPNLFYFINDLVQSNSRQLTADPI